jgi:hypothetical protein
LDGNVYVPPRRGEKTPDWLAALVRLYGSVGREVKFSPSFISQLVGICHNDCEERQYSK